MKRAFVFSLDAIIVLGFVLTLTFFLSALSFTYSSPELRYQRLYYTGKDLLNVIGQAKLSSVQDNPVVQDYFSKGILIQDDMNKTILDVIGSLWASGNLTEARNLTNSTFAQILNGTRVDYQLLIDSQLIHEKNTTATTYLARLSAIVSGYDIGKPVSGYSARTKLSKVNRISSSYVYFGGYIGDGNITVNFTLPQFDSVLSSSMEMNAGNNFSLYINGNPSGTYLKNAAANMIADKWTIGSSYLQYFAPGNNIININFTQNRSMYIGGGYLKITYNTSELADSNETFGENATMRERIPGIQGIINMYSSFYTPGTLNNMSVYLHYLSNYTVFMTIGNKTVYQGNSTSENSVSLNNSYLSGLLNYSALSQKTIPFRIGLLNISYMSVGALGIGDPVLVTDVSGSMSDCAIYAQPYYRCNYSCFIGGPKSCIVSLPSQCTGNVCGGSCLFPYGHFIVCNQTKLYVAKDADRLFVDIVLNESIPGNRVGLVSYSTSVTSYQNFTDNKTILNSSISGYTSGGNTCICCGINRATNMSKDLSNSSRRRSTVVMTDGEANVGCTENKATTDLNGDSIVNAKDDTINASCMAYQKYNITVYTVGFGASESDVDSNTLNMTAQCGNGKYYYSNITELANTFRQIAQEILNASYSAQTVEIQGNITYMTKLYPDSYIQLGYVSSIQPAGYGEVMLTFESANFGNMTGNQTITDNTTGTKEGWYYLPENMQIVDSKITSYSSNYWTDRLYVNNTGTSNWTRIYWLGDYGSNYTSLGDPFIVQIPVSYTAKGNNSVRIGTGLSAINGTGGSPDDRVIYTLKIGGIAFEQYSDVFPKAKGATVTVYYDINGDNVYDGYSNVSYGPDPSDIFDPQNDSIDDSFMRLMDSLNFIGDLNPSSYGNGTLGNPYDGINQINPVDLQITSDVEFDSVA
ncbi:MAG: VWA domain-containing protein, partial [Candidatus Aenigmarchaeota archaeon]|nr:VWA domain-containing protein [Candidatus Aenigmarchaeota archaeon]